MADPNGQYVLVPVLGQSAGTLTWTLHPDG